MKPLVYKKAEAGAPPGARADAPARHQGRHRAGDLGRRQGQAGRGAPRAPQDRPGHGQGVNIVKRHQRATPDGGGGDHRARGADPSLEGDAARSEERGAHAGPPADGRRRDGGADRREVGSVDPEEPVTMAETTREGAEGKAPKKSARPRARRARARRRRRAAGAVDHAPKAAEGTPRLQEYYEKTVRAKLQKDFGLPNPHQVPRLEKVVLNIGMGDAGKNPKQLEAAVEELGLITGQHAGGHPGQEGDRQLRPPGGHAGRLHGDAARRADVRVPGPLHHAGDPPDPRLPRAAQPELRRARATTRSASRSR